MSKREVEQAIKLVQSVMDASIQKRSHAEVQLIEEARKPYAHRVTNSKWYIDALLNTIEVESCVITYMQTEIENLKTK